MPPEAATRSERGRRAAVREDDGDVRDRAARLDVGARALRVDVRRGRVVRGRRCAGEIPADGAVGRVNDGAAGRRLRLDVRHRIAGCRGAGEQGDPRPTLVLPNLTGLASALEQL